MIAGKSRSAAIAPVETIIRLRQIANKCVTSCLAQRIMEVMAAPCRGLIRWLENRRDHNLLASPWRAQAIHHRKGSQAQCEHFPSGKFGMRRRFMNGATTITALGGPTLSFPASRSDRPRRTEHVECARSSSRRDLSDVLS